MSPHNSDSGKCSSSRSLPASFISRRICSILCSASGDGIERPFSQRLIVGNETPSLAANFSCVRPSRVRSSLISPVQSGSLNVLPRKYATRFKKSDRMIYHVMGQCNRKMARADAFPRSPDQTTVRCMADDHSAGKAARPTGANAAGGGLMVDTVCMRNSGCTLARTYGLGMRRLKIARYMRGQGKLPISANLAQCYSRMRLTRAL